MSDNENTHDSGERKAIINKSLDWANTLFLSEQAKTLRFARDKDNNIWAVAAVLFDPSQTGIGTLAQGRVGIGDPITQNSLVRAFGTPRLGFATDTVGLIVQANQMLYNPATALNEIQRTPTIWKNTSGTAAGSTALWTPAGGKKFRLMGGIITLTKDAACAAQEFISLKDSATTIFRVDVSDGALVATGNVVVYNFDFPGNGYLSVAADNVLNLSLNGALTAGRCAITVWGTEE